MMQDRRTLEGLRLVGLSTDAVDYLNSCGEGAKGSPLGKTGWDFRGDAFFAQADQDAQPSHGRFQEVIVGRLYEDPRKPAYLLDNGKFVLKVPRPRLDEDAGAAEDLSEMEADGLVALAGLSDVFPFPAGRATLVEGDGETRTRCVIQRCVAGKTLKDLLYDGNRRSQRKLNDFLMADSDGAGPWLADVEATERPMDGKVPILSTVRRANAGHLPFLPIVRSVIGPLSKKLADLEGKGWQHRDISPANIMYDERKKEFFLIDIALVSEVGKKVDDGGGGTAPYGLPDQPDRVVAGTDSRALLAICWELLGFDLGNDGRPAARSCAYFDEGRATYSDALVDALVYDALPNWRGEHGPSRAMRLAVRNTLIQYERLLHDKLKSALQAPAGKLESAPATAKWLEDWAVGLESTLLKEVERSMRDGGERREHFTLFLVLACILGLGYAVEYVSPPLNGALCLLADNLPALSAFSLLLALLQIIVGVCIDSPIAWTRFRKASKGTPLTLGAFQRVAKYGSVDAYVPGAGRYDPTPGYCLYSGLCNAIGAVCNVTVLFAFFCTEGFREFVAGMDNAFASGLGFVAPIAVVVACFIAWKNEKGSQSMPPYVEGMPLSPNWENPDIHAFTRAHVWANMLHLAWTLSLIIIMGILFIAFAVLNFRKIACPWILAVPVLSWAVFFLWSSVSPRAVKIQANALGGLAVSAAIDILCALLFALVIFLPSPGSVLLVVLSAAIFAALLLADRGLRGGRGLASNDAAATSAYDVGRAYTSSADRVESWKSAKPTKEVGLYVLGALFVVLVSAMMIYWHASF